MQTGHWTGQLSGIGAGMDSFYEYLLKSFILFNEVDDLEIFKISYETIKAYLRKGFVHSRPAKLHFLIDWFLMIPLTLPKARTVQRWWRWSSNLRQCRHEEWSYFNHLDRRFTSSKHSFSFTKLYLLNLYCIRRHSRDCKCFMETSKRQYAATLCIMRCGKSGTPFPRGSTGSATNLTSFSIHSDLNLLNQPTCFIRLVCKR